MSDKKVLIVIPTLDEAASIEGVVADLSADLPSDWSSQFVVVDGGSRDATVALVERMATMRRDVVLLRNPQRFQGAAVNLAVRRFGDGADAVVRCDAHADYPPGYVAKLLESLERHGADAVVVPMDAAGRSCLQRAIGWVCDTAVGSGGAQHRGGQASGFVDHGHHAAFRLDSFCRSGGYDPTFSHNEDAELDCRQRALGGRIYLDSSIRIGYHPRATFRALARQYFNYGRGRSRTVRRHPASLRLRQVAVPVHVASVVAAMALAPVWPEMLAWPLVYATALAATGVCIAVRHRSVCGLLAGPAALVMHVAWAAGFATGFVRRSERRWSSPGATSGTVAADSAATFDDSHAEPLPRWRDGSREA